MKHQPVSRAKPSTSEATMKSCFILILMLAGAASKTIEKRIVGGKSCGKDREYHVEIKTVQGEKPCAGALLNTRWVLTAAHCGGRLVNVHLGKAWNRVLSLGKNYKQKIDVKQQFVYKDESGNDHDIMLLKLNVDANSELPTIKPPMMDCKRPALKHQVEIGGWGATKANVKKPKFPFKLQCASTAIIDCGDHKVGGNYHSDEQTTMCAFHSGVESCFGDAGSAVEYNDVLYGIIVSDPVDKCANPIVMLDICFYKAWIDETMLKHD